MTYRFVTDDVLDEVAELLIDRKMTNGEAARALGKSYRTVSRYAKRLRNRGDLKESVKPEPMSEQELAMAKAMLEDHSGYAETARTLGRSPKSLQRRLPGYQLSRAESLERAEMGRKFNQLPRFLEAS